MRCHGWRALAALFSLSLAGACLADARRTAGAGFGLSVRVGGTEELRQAASVHLQWLRPERALKLGGINGYLVYELHAAYSWGGKPNPLDPFQVVWEGGALAMGRWELGAWRRVRLFAEAGWGLSVNSVTTVDLDSHVNSTPLVGLGVLLPSGGEELQLTLRLIHFSNAGTRGGNKGHNRLMLILSRRY
jgi:hypothetical protein